MAEPKKRKTVKTQKKTKQTTEKASKPLIPEKHQKWVYPVILGLAVFIFFSGVIFSGGGFNVDDNIASASFRPYMEKGNASDHFPLWMPYIFSGLPGYAALLTSGTRLWDIVPEAIIAVTEFVGQVFSSDAARVICFYVIFSIGMYLLMRFKKHSRFVAFFTAFAAVFSTGVIIWVMIGHNTKPMVFAMFPYIFIFLEKLRIKFSFIYTALLIFAVHFMMIGGHLQMIFYGICAFGLYLIFEFISRIIKKKQPMNVVRAAVLLAIAGGFAFIMSSDRYLATFEYTPYSTRGSAPIVKQDDANKTESGGHDYDYATMWSFSPQEMATFVVPNYFGFGKMTYDGPLVQEQQMIRTYWGPKPFEDAAPYMGIIIFALAILGAIVHRRVVFVQFLIALSIFSLFLSFGKNLPILYDFFYYYVPSFNKFRAPSMALALMQFAFPIMAGYGISSIISWRKDQSQQGKKIISIGMIISVIFLLIGFLFSAMFKDAYLDAVASSQIGQRLPAELHTFIWDKMISDWYVTAFIAIAAFALIYFYVKRSVPQGIFYFAIFGLLIFDLWRVAYRPMEYDEVSIEEKYFQKKDWVEFLEQDNSLYRIADFASRSPNMAAYWHLQNVNGYHAAKVRVYQDILDAANQIERGSTSNLRNTLLWNLLNVKYIITDKNLSGNGQLMFNIGPDGKAQSLKSSYPVRYQSNTTQNYVFQNMEALPRTFFVDYAVKAEKMEILNHLRNADFNPRETAFVEKELPVDLDKPTPKANAKVMDYKFHNIKIEASATGNNLLFLGEVYYPPGWKAFIDGEETEIFKTNYGFRSVIVPEGKHTVEFKYESEQFRLGKTLSIIANIITFAILIAGIFIGRKKPEKIESDEERT